MSEKSVVYEVQGMSCHHCERAVNSALGALDGVVAVASSHNAARVEVTFAGEPVEEAILKAIVEEEGYTWVGPAAS